MEQDNKDQSLRDAMKDVQDAMRDQSQVMQQMLQTMQAMMARMEVQNRPQPIRVGERDGIDGGRERGFEDLEAPPIQREQQRHDVGLPRYVDQPPYFEHQNRWKDFLERQAESASISSRDLSPEEGGNTPSLGDGSDRSELGVEETGPEKRTVEKETRTQKIQICSQIRPSLGAIEQMMSHRVKKRKNLTGGEQDAERSGAHVAPTEEGKPVEDSDDEFYDVERSDSNQEALPSDGGNADSAADVAGAGACLKRYSDPSSFKMELASSGMLETELPREKKAHKVKKKGTRCKNGQTLESLLAPHADSDLQPMTSDQVSEKTSRHVRLKSRHSNGMDKSNESSLMERLLEISSEQKVLFENSIGHSHVKINPIDSNESAPEIYEIVYDSSADCLLVKETNPIQSPVRKEVAGLPLYELETQKIKKKDFSGALHGSFGELKITDSDYLVVEQEEMSTKSGYKSEGSVNGYALSEPKKIPLALQVVVQNKLLGDAECIIEGDAGGYRSDDISSDLDNFMDALNTMESETETDSECRPKGDPVVFIMEPHGKDSDSNEAQQELQTQFSEPDSVDNSTNSFSWNNMFKNEMTCVSDSDTTTSSIVAQPTQRNIVSIDLPANSETCPGKIHDRFTEELWQNDEVMEFNSSSHLVSSSCVRDPTSVIVSVHHQGSCHESRSVTGDQNDLPSAYEASEADEATKYLDGLSLESDDLDMPHPAEHLEELTSEDTEACLGSIISHNIPALPLDISFTVQPGGLAEEMENVVAPSEHLTCSSSTVGLQNTEEMGEVNISMPNTLTPELEYSNPEELQEFPCVISVGFAHFHSVEETCPSDMLLQCNVLNSEVIECPISVDDNLKLLDEPTEHISQENMLQTGGPTQFDDLVSENAIFDHNSDNAHPSSTYSAESLGLQVQSHETSILDDAGSYQHQVGKQEALTPKDTAVLDCQSIQCVILPLSEEFPLVSAPTAFDPGFSILESSDPSDSRLLSDVCQTKSSELVQTDLLSNHDEANSVYSLESKQDFGSKALRHGGCENTEEKKPPCIHFLSELTIPLEEAASKFQVGSELNVLSVDQEGEHLHAPTSSIDLNDEPLEQGPELRSHGPASNGDVSEFVIPPSNKPMCSQVLEKFGDNAYRVELPDDVFISDVFNIRHLTPYAGENSSLRSSFSEEGESDEDIKSDQGLDQPNQALNVPVPATQSQQTTSGKPAPDSLRRSKRLQNKQA